MNHHTTTSDIPRSRKQQSPTPPGSQDPPASTQERVRAGWDDDYLPVGSDGGYFPEYMAGGAYRSVLNPYYSAMQPTMIPRFPAAAPSGAHDRGNSLGSAVPPQPQQQQQQAVTPWPTPTARLAARQKRLQKYQYQQQQEQHQQQSIKKDEENVDDVESRQASREQLIERVGELAELLTKTAGALHNVVDTLSAQMAAGRI